MLGPFARHFCKFLDKEISLRLKASLLMLLPRVFALIMRKLRELVSVLLPRLLSGHATICVGSFDVFALNLLANELRQVKRYFTVLVKHFVVELGPLLQKESESGRNLVYNLLFETVQMGSQISLDLSSESLIDFDLLWTHVLNALFAAENEICELINQFLSLLRHR